MIRKFENRDLDDVMEIWKNENIKAHNFIQREYWENNYDFVKEALPKAEIYVYIIEGKIVGFVITSKSIDDNTKEIEYTMTWNE